MAARRGLLSWLLLPWLLLDQAAADDRQGLSTRLESWRDRALVMATRVECIDGAGQHTQSLAHLRLIVDQQPARSEDGKPAAQLSNGSDFASQVRSYNQGIALIRNGRGDQGATALDRTGRLHSNDPTMQALADRANLALASLLLDQGRAASAIPILGRIRSEGPYASRAILALGWAWLLPAGDWQMQAELGDERSLGPPPESFAGRDGPIRDSNLYQRYRVRPFVRASIPANENARVERALAAWAELIDRDADDTAVVEGWLAIAGALDGLGAHADALRFRERALNALEAKTQRLQEAMRLANAERWIEALQQHDQAEEPGSDWKLRALPGPALARYLAESLASQPFQTALHELHDYSSLQNIFVDLDRRLAATEVDGVDNVQPEVLMLRLQLVAWQAQLETDRRSQRDEIRAMALDVLEQQSDRLRERLIATRLEIAKQVDQ